MYPNFSTSCPFMTRKTSSAAIIKRYFLNLSMRKFILNAELFLCTKYLCLLRGVMMSRIFTYEDNCTGCNKCIEACPVDCANEAYLTPSGARKIRVNGDYCIHCGACLAACDHGARDYTDDTEQFFQDLASGQQISVIAAPAAQVNFDDMERLFGWLKSAGVKHIYDVSMARTSPHGPICAPSRSTVSIPSSRSPARPSSIIASDISRTFCPTCPRSTAR